MRGQEEGWAACCACDTAFQPLLNLGQAGQLHTVSHPSKVCFNLRPAQG